MSSFIPINHLDPTAPTPQNTPLTHAPIAAGLSRPTVPDITEGDEPTEDEEETGGDAMQNAMLGLVHGKLAGLVGRSSGYIESLPVEVKRSVEGLKGIQVKHSELQNQYKRECLELEKKVATRDSFIDPAPLLSSVADKILFNSTSSSRLLCTSVDVRLSAARLSQRLKKSQRVRRSQRRRIQSTLPSLPRPAPLKSPSSG